MQKLLENRILLIPLLIGVAAGAVVAIAGGFLSTYQLVTWIGN